jgi:hypothetical protein
MKKRNKPIILVTVLILMIGAVAFINFPKDLVAGAGDGHDHSTPQAPPTGETVDVPDRNEIAQNVAGSINKKSDLAEAGAPPGASRPGAVPSAPAIAIPKAQPYKPTPSDSATSTQWYTDETPKEIPAKK